MKKINCFLQPAFIVCLTFLFSACGKQEKELSPLIGGERSNLANILVEPDVYIAGYETLPGFTKTVAKYWKNGVAVTLGAGTYSSYASGIVLSGSDVYVAGYEYNASGKSIAKYWKNGVAVAVSNGTNNAYGRGITVVGTDVYVCGDESIQLPSGYYRSIAKYWKNGVAVDVSDGITSASANSIAVSGTDVYVAGSQQNASDYSQAKYWKNSVSVVLSSVNSSRANGIVIVGSNVHVAGIVPTTGSDAVVTYWQNGTVVTLSGANGAYGSTASSTITASGSDIYVTGSDRNAGYSGAKYWKNAGTPVVLTNGQYNDAAGIAVLNSDVYVSGTGYNANGFVPTCWKNGTILNTFGSSMVHPFGIAVKYP